MLVIVLLLLTLSTHLTVAQVEEGEREYNETDEKESVFYPLIPQENVTDIFGDLNDEESQRIQRGIQFYAFPNRKASRQHMEIKYGDPNSLSRAGLIPGQPIHIFAHGFGGKAPQKKHYSIIHSYINEGAPNVVVVNYQSAHPGIGDIPVVLGVSWFAAQWKYAPSTGQRIADFIVFLIKHRIISDASQVHLIGHSLGGHVMGCAGHRLQTQYGYKVGRITGLDVAGPFYGNVPGHHKLDSSDATFVDVLHTDIDAVGIAESIGHVDYYSNGGLGRNQNGCQFKNGIIPIVSYIKTIQCAHDERPIRIWGYGVSKRVNLQACPCSSSYGKRRLNKLKQTASQIGQPGSNSTQPQRGSITETDPAAVEVPDTEDSNKLRRKTEICERPRRGNCIRFGEYTPTTSRGRYYLPITDSTFRQILQISRRNEV